MKTVSPARMPAEHAILGLLDLDDGSGHGYDLMRHFGEGQPLAGVLRLEPGMLYHHLKKMAAAGWAVSHVEQRGTRPPRQVYQITAAGRAELRRWLREPVAHTRDIRLDFLVKLYFARRLDRDLAARLIAEQLAICERIAQSLTARLAALGAASDRSRAENEEPGDDRSFTRLVLDLRIAQTRAAIAWLIRAASEF